MKLFFNITILIVGFFLFSCSGNSNSGEKSTEVTKEDQPVNQNMQKIDLSDYQLTASIYIPNESEGKAEINTTDWGSIEIRVGNSYGIEIIPFGMNISDKRAELASDLVYEIEYLVEDDNAILYKKTIKNSDIEPEFHFFSTRKINGDIIELNSLNEASYTKNQVEKMLESASSLSTIE